MFTLWSRWYWSMAYWYLAAFSPSAPASLSPRKSQANLRQWQSNLVKFCLNVHVCLLFILCFGCICHITYSAAKSSQPEWQSSSMRIWAKVTETKQNYYSARSDVTYLPVTVTHPHWRFSEWRYATWLLLLLLTVFVLQSFTTGEVDDPSLFGHSGTSKLCLLDV